jgi:MerR family transcriptional regulator/heat shock protein HspR
VGGPAAYPFLFEQVEPAMTHPLDDHNAPLYTVGQVSSILSVQPAFLRRLDAENLVSPERSEGGQRRYSRAEIAQIERVAELAGEGMTLAGIKRLMALEAEVSALRKEIKRLQGGDRAG